MEAGQDGLTRVTCSLHAVSSWTRLPGCCGFRGVFLGGGGGFFCVFFFLDFLFSSNAHGLLHEAAYGLIYPPTSSNIPLVDA